MSGEDIVVHLAKGVAADMALIDQQINIGWSDLALDNSVAPENAVLTHEFFRELMNDETAAGQVYGALDTYTSDQIAGLPDPGDDADPRTLVPMTEALELLIGYGQAAGELRPYPSARDLSGLLVNTVLIRNVNRPGEGADSTAELLLTVMFGTLRPEELVGAERPFPAAR